MKKQKILSVATGILLALAAVAGSAAGKVSPALDILAENVTMKKCGRVLEDICFSAKDIDVACGVGRVDSLTVDSLPDGGSGRLMLGSEPVSKGQVIKRQEFGELKFSSYSPEGIETSFDMTAAYPGGSERVCCEIYTLTEENSAPTAITGRYYPDTVRTYENVPVYSTMPASDAEGDELEFRIVSYPKNGTVKLTNAAVGNYRYTPNEDFAGEDSFGYTVSDKYGNTSETLSISVIVEKRIKNGAVFEDMNGHWAQYASLRLTDEGIMSYYESDGKYYFEPTAPVTRAQFVKTAMKAFGYSPVSGDSGRFSDLGETPYDCAGYVTAAGEAGIVCGSTDINGNTVFRPNAAITRAEASVILCRLADTEEVSVTPVFSDMTYAPEWSENAIYTLKEQGLICGTGGGNVSPDKIMTRAEAAQIIVKMIEQ